MGAAIARDAPPALQTIVSALLRTKIELAIAGLDASGKSTLAACLRDPMLAAAGESTKPTIGWWSAARQRGIDVMLWDLGEHRRFRTIGANTFVAAVLISSWMLLTQSA